MCADFLKPFPNVIRWFETCTHQPEFNKVLGDVKVAGGASASSPKKGAAAAPKKDEKKPAPKRKQMR